MRSKTMWSQICARADSASSSDAEDFFKENFVPWKVQVQQIGKQSGALLNITDSGLMTGYYEPLLRASRHKQSEKSTPILSTPQDLIIVDLASLYPKLKGMRLRGKLEGRRLVPYDDRAEILERKDLEKYAVAWSEDEIGVFFLQIQGSGRLQLDDGTVMRVGYDDQNGHPYKAVGSWLVQKGYLKQHEVSMQNIKKWAAQNPSKVNELLNQNPSFVFFKVRAAGAAEEGPIGAQGVPLTPGASVAADRKYYPMGTPLVVEVNQSQPALSFTRPVVAQDTGGAIRGPLRFDYFWGFGDEGARNAGKQKSQVKAWLLLPEGVDPQTLN